MAELAIPLVHRDRLVGVLNIEGPDAEAVHAGGAHRAAGAGRHLAVAIENATLYRETRWYAGLLATLYEIGKETASILDLDELLHRVAEVVKRVIDYEMFGILLLDEERQELVLRKAVSYGADPGEDADQAGRGPVRRRGALTKQPILVGDVREDPRYLDLIPETRSELVVPLRAQGPRGRRVRPRVAAARPLHRGAREGADAAGQPGGGGDRERAALRRARAATTTRLAARAGDRARRPARPLPRGARRTGAGWEASAHFRPARELGGDLYDFYDMGEGLLGLAVGDVAGKGVPAALYAAFASGTVRARAFERRTARPTSWPASTAPCGGGAWRASSARSPSPSSTSEHAALRWPTPACPIRSTTGPAPDAAGRSRWRACPWGPSTASTYEELGVELAPGDVFVFHTDGVIEARQRAGGVRG